MAEKEEEKRMKVVMQNGNDGLHYNQTEEEKKQARETWDSWLNDMSERDQPEACNIDNPDCENCGS
jgi:hypothetical protein